TFDQPFFSLIELSVSSITASYQSQTTFVHFYSSLQSFTMGYEFHSIFLAALLFCSKASFAIQVKGYDYELGLEQNEIAEDVENKGPYFVKPVEYSVLCEYDFDINKGDDKLSMENLVWLSQQAWMEMSTLHKNWYDTCKADGGKGRRFIGNAKPGMMAAVAYGKTIVFASSIKQNNPNQLILHSRESLFTRGLARCRQEWITAEPERFPHLHKDLYHRNQANCAEIMAFAIMFKETKGKLPKDIGAEEGEKVRSAAWGSGTTKENDLMNEGKVFDPCSGIDPDENMHKDGKIGCKEILKDQNVEYATTATEADKTDKRPKKCRQVSLKDAFVLKEITTGEEEL
ncbi:hypothetical protein BDV96DRAFT_674978, partial [Lophiotrema nucula]